MNEKNFADIVVGQLNRDLSKPCISSPELVIEVKAFPLGFTDQQHRVHYFHVIEDDLPKLAALKTPQEDRYILLFDEDFYLKGTDYNSNSSRIKNIEKIRDSLDPKIKICNIFKQETLNWVLL